MSTLDIQVGGNHYKKYKYQPIEYFMDARLNPLSSNISKYILRYKDKNGIEDLEKALQYSEFGIKKNNRPSNKKKNVSQNSLKHYNNFVNQLDASLEIEINILKASLYEDYNLCNSLISDLILKEYSVDDSFDYISNMTDIANRMGVDILKSINLRRFDGESFTFIASFLFVLHKYDITIVEISEKLGIDTWAVRSILDRAYNMLEDGDNPFIFEMNSMFNKVEELRKCKK